MTTARRVCISAASPESFGLAGFELGEFTRRPAGFKITFAGTDALVFAASMDALITWNPLHLSVVRELRIRRPGIRIGLALAIEAITATPHSSGETTLNRLRDALLPLAFDPVVDPYETSQPAFPAGPHAICIDFENRGAEVVAAVRGFLETIRRYEFDLVFFDTCVPYRYFGSATNPPPTGPTYQQTWEALIKWTQANVAPVWGHSDAVLSAGMLHDARVVEHFYRASQNDRNAMVADSKNAGKVLVRSGEWANINSIGLDKVVKELYNAPTPDAWIVSARSGSAFGIFDV